ncbi:MAG: ABC transporter ATP-binding protein [Flavobacteriales bacterium]|nr:ABC transporter ATP-binding protein [Flavobacteriales bacterium]
MIRIDHLTFEYPNQFALNDVSCSFQKNAITALVGPNGAGKTTLLKCLSALLKPYSGHITVDGIDVIENPRDVNKVMGFLPDFFGLYDELTIYQSLYYFALAHNFEHDLIENRIVEVVERLALSNKMHEKTGTLSRGMRQRLAIGQAIIHRPKVLLLDEPASGLDPEARHSLALLFHELKEQGMTLVVSSHILAELDAYADNLIILKEGKVSENSILKEVENVGVKIEFSLLFEVASLRADLEKIKGVGAIFMDHKNVSLTFNGDEAEQHELLKHLLNAKVPISQFYIKKANIQDQYLDIVRKN